MPESRIRWVLDVDDRGAIPKVLAAQKAMQAAIVKTDEVHKASGATAVKVSDTQAAASLRTIKHRQSETRAVVETAGAYKGLSRVHAEALKIGSALEKQANARVRAYMREREALKQVEAQERQRRRQAGLGRTIPGAAAVRAADRGAGRLGATASGALIAGGAVLSGGTLAALATARSGIAEGAELANATAGLKGLTGVSQREAAALALVAKEINVSSRVIGMTFSTLGKQVIGLGEGTKNATKAFGALKISESEVKKLKGNLPALFDLVYKRAQKLPGTERAATLKTLFGRGATLGGEIEAAGPFAGQVKEVSKLMGGVDPKKLDEMATAQLHIQEATTAVKLQFADTFGPYLVKLIDLSLPAIRGFGALLHKVIEGSIDFVRKHLPEITMVWGKIKSAAKAVWPVVERAGVGAWHGIQKAAEAAWPVIEKVSELTFGGAKGIVEGIVKGVAHGGKQSRDRRSARTVPLYQEPGVSANTPRFPTNVPLVYAPGRGPKVKAGEPFSQQPVPVAPVPINTFQKIGEEIVKVGKVIGKAVGQGAGEAWKALKPLIPALKEVWAGFKVLLPVLEPLAKLMLGSFLLHWKVFIFLLHEAAKLVLGVARTVRIVNEAFVAMVKWVVGAGKAIGHFFADIGPILGKVIGLTVGLTAKMLLGLRSLPSRLLDLVGKAGAFLAKGIVSWGGKAVSAVGHVAGVIIGAIDGIGKKVFDAFWNLGRTMVKAIVSGLKSAFSWVINTLSDIAPRFDVGGFPFHPHFHMFIGDTKVFREGGLVPARVSPGEQIVYGNSSMTVPGPRTAADSVGMMLPVGAAVLTRSGQAMMAHGASMDQALAYQAPHFAKGGVVSYGGLEGLWDRAHGPKGKAPLAAAIALAESAGQIGNVGDHGTSFGLWQIHTPAHPQYSSTRLLNDPLYNAGAAVAISGHGTNFAPWTTYKTGAYKPFLHGGVKATTGAINTTVDRYIKAHHREGLLEGFALGLEGGTPQAAGRTLAEAIGTVSTQVSVAGISTPTKKKTSELPKGLETPNATWNPRHLQIADWIVPYLSYGAKHGWNGIVTSGYRSEAEQRRIYNSGVRPAARPGTSKHEGAAYPSGAVDVEGAPALSHALAHMPGPHLLKWAGSADKVHFSHPVNGKFRRGGIVGYRRGGNVTEQPPYSAPHYRQRWGNRYHGYWLWRHGGRGRELYGAGREGLGDKLDASIETYWGIPTRHNREELVSELARTHHVDARGWMGKWERGDRFRTGGNVKEQPPYAANYYRQKWGNRYHGYYLWRKQGRGRELYGGGPYTEPTQSIPIETYWGISTEKFADEAAEMLRKSHHVDLYGWEDKWKAAKAYQGGGHVGRTGGTQAPGGRGGGPRSIAGSGITASSLSNLAGNANAFANVIGQLDVILLRLTDSRLSKLRQQFVREASKGGSAKVVKTFQALVSATDFALGHHVAELFAGIEARTNSVSRAGNLVDRRISREGLTGAAAARLRVKTDETAVVNRGQIVHEAQTALAKVKRHGTAAQVKEASERLLNVQDELEEAVIKRIEDQREAIRDAAQESLEQLDINQRLAHTAGTGAGELEKAAAINQTMIPALQQIGASAIEIGNALAEASDLIREGVETSAREVTERATHATSMAQIGEQRQELEQRLSGTFNTGAAARAEYITTQVLPALQAELAALQSEQSAALSVGDSKLAEQIGEAVANKQNDVLQAQLTAQEAIKSNTDKQPGGLLSFSYGGETLTDAIINSGNGV